MRLLVVEDDARLLGLLCDALRESGFAVDGVADGEEGLFYACEYPIDLARWPDHD